jgi:hypothetical protein
MGWETLAGKPVELVRRLFWRVYASQAWDKQLVDASRQPIPDGPGSFRARVAKGDAVKIVDLIRSELWPEGD